MTKSKTEKPRFQFVVGVSLPVLEKELNEVDAELELRQIFYAQGAGFVAVLEHPAPDRPRGKKHE